MRRLGRRDEGEKRRHPAPRQGALQAPCNPLLMNVQVLSRTLVCTTVHDTQGDDHELR